MVQKFINLNQKDFEILTHSLCLGNISKIDKKKYEENWTYEPDEN